MWFTGWSEIWLQITCKHLTLKAPISTWVISSLFNLHIFLLWCTWGNIISKHQDISSGLIISFFLLIFQLIWLWYCWEKFKIGYYGGRVPGESHFTLQQPSPDAERFWLQILQYHRKLINLEDQARWRRGGTGCTN